MNTLLIKDLRQSLWPMLLAAVLLLAPPTAWLAFQLGDTLPMPRGADLRRELTAVFWFGAVASLIASSSIAGTAFAKERRERTAEMVATLPISRWKVFASKSAVALFLAITPFAIGTLIAFAISPGVIRDDVADTLRTSNSLQWVLALGASGWLLLFGLAWGLSSILRSEVLSSALPLLVLVLLASSIFLWTKPTLEERPPWRSAEERSLPRFVYPFTAIGLTGLIAGTVIALRRKSP